MSVVQNSFNGSRDISYTNKTTESKECFAKDKPHACRPPKGPKNAVLFGSGDLKR